MSHYTHHVLFTIATMLILTACGGGGDVGDLSPTSTTIPTSELAVATDPSPTAELDIETTDTPVAEVPEEPTTTPLPAVTSEPAEIATICEHPYYPLKTGTQWTYAVSGVGEGVEQIHSVGQITEGANGTSAQLTYMVEGVIVENEVICSASGLQFGEYNNLTLNTPDAEGIGSFETIESTGVYLPPADQLVPGATWTANYVIEGSLDAGGQVIETTQEVEVAYELEGTESISVAAGDFEAIRVKQTLTQRFVDSGLLQGAPEFTFEGTLWFAENVGLVQSEVNVQNVGTTTQELTTYEAP